MILFAFFLMQLSPSDAQLRQLWELDRKKGHRSYPFCYAITDPFPDLQPQYALATVKRTVLPAPGRGLLRAITAGTRILVAKGAQGYHPVFDMRGTGNEGSVPASALGRIAKPRPVNDPRQWVGHWAKIQQGDPDTIEVRQAGGRLHLQGYATWKATIRSAGNMGSFGDSGILRNGLVRIGEGDRTACHLSFTLIGRYLVVFDRDDSGCNGNNVRFSGVYRRSPGLVARQRREQRV